MSTDQNNGGDGNGGGQQGGTDGNANGGGDGNGGGGDGTGDTGQQRGSSAADFLDGGANDGDTGNNGGDKGGGDGNGGGDDGKPWYEGLTGSDALDDKGTKADDWLKAKGFKSLDDVIKSNRQLENQLRNGDKLSVPGEDATDEDREAFFKAIGRPDEATGYELETPEGVGLNEPLIDHLRGKAFEAGVPKAMFEGLGKELIDFQLNEQLAQVEKQEKLGAKWEGEQEDLALSKRLMSQGAKALGLSADDITEMDLSLPSMGRDRLYDMLKKVGTAAGEDVFIEPDGGRNLFGVTGPEAQKQLDQLNKDEAWRAKISAGDATALAQRERLMKAISAHEAAERERGR